MDVRLPSDFQQEKSGVKHCAIVGRNGTGKTVALLWHISLMDFGAQPFVIVDPKADSHLSKLGATRMAVTDPIPSKPGLYITSMNSDEEDQFSGLCSRIKERGGCGLIVDEGHATRRATGFQDLLSQGRSKRCPVIVLTQRPVWISRFVWSECSLFQIFPIGTESDRQSLEDGVPLRELGFEWGDLRKRESFWYDTDQNEACVLGPVPPPADSIRAIRAQLREVRARQEGKHLGVKTL